MRTRLILLAIPLALAGCALPGEDAGAREGLSHEDAPRWTFTERVGNETPRALGAAEGFALERELEAGPAMRQIGGQWHSGVQGGVPFTLRFEASVPMNVSFRLADATGATTTGTCDWGERWDVEKDVALGRARMRNDATSCEIRFTPTIDLRDDDGPTLRWEARSGAAHAEGWRLAFNASTGDQPESVRA